MQYPSPSNRNIRRQALAKLLPCLVFMVAGLIVSSEYGGIRKGSDEHKFIALIGVVVFLIFAITFLQILATTIGKMIESNGLGIGRAAALQFIVNLLGYITILFITLDHLGIPVGHILLGSAVLGIILGVAAQQALANFFASIVLIISHPFSVGDKITLISGALGGKHEGTVIDIGLTHTHLMQKDGLLVSLPNSTLLTGAAIMPEKHKKEEISNTSS